MCCVWAYIVRYQQTYKTKEYNNSPSNRSIVNFIFYFPKKWLFRYIYLMLKLLLYTRVTITSKILAWFSSFIGIFGHDLAFILAWFSFYIRTILLLYPEKSTTVAFFFWQYPLSRFLYSKTTYHSQNQQYTKGIYSTNCWSPRVLINTW